MYRGFKSIISSSLFLSLSLLPSLTMAAEGDTNSQNARQNQGDTGAIQNNPSTQQGWSNTPGASYGQQSWNNNPGTTYSYQNRRGDQNPAYTQQGWRGDQGAVYSNQGWDANAQYSHGQPAEHPVHDVPGSMEHNYGGGYYENPGYSSYSSDANFNRNRVIEPSERNCSYSPGFHRARGRSYNSSANSNPSYSNYSYSYPSNDGYPSNDSMALEWGGQNTSEQFFFTQFFYFLCKKNTQICCPPHAPPTSTT